ncbi:FxsA family protein [Marininema halotolerans]|nr:FxsA family protein [Marininema halotolerans]
MFRIGMLMVLVVAMIEIWGLVAAGNWIGPLPTIGMVIGSSLIGAWFARKQGLAVIRLAKVQLDHRQIPGEAIIDGICILFGGLLLIMPGFLTDSVGILLLIPLTRGIVKILAKQKLLSWIQNGKFTWIDRRTP